MSAQHRVIEQRVYEFGEFRLDPKRHALHSLVRQEPIVLTPRVYDTLLYLVENCGQVLNKARLMKAIWPNAVVEENNLNQHICALRRVLGDGEQGMRYVLTVPRRGYKFIAEVRTIATVAAEGGSARNSIAVLPFANLSGNVEREYFAEGMAEELIQLLLQIPGIKVPARTSSFVYRQRGIDVRRIAADLQVATVLEGSVSGTNDHVRIHLQLSDGATGHQIWGGRFDRPFHDLFRLQSEMAATIGATLKQHLGIELAPTAATAAPCNDLQAYELYLQASSLMLWPHAVNLRKAIELLQQAAARDTRFARAFAQASIAHGLAYHERYRDAEALHCAEHAARQALALEPTNAMALTTLAITHAVRLDWLQSEAYFHHALRSDERETMIHRARTGLYLLVGHIQLALRHAKRAYELAPGHWFNIVGLASVLSTLGCDEEAVRYIDLAASLGVPRENASMCGLRWSVARRTGDIEMAVRNLALLLPEAMCRQTGERLLEYVHIGMAAPAHRTAAMAALRELDALTRAASTVATCPAPSNHDLLIKPKIICAVLLGDLDLAYEMMDRAMTALEGDLAFYHHILLWHPDFRALRRDGRFQSIVQRFRLPSYWKVYGAPDGCELQGDQLLVH